MSLWWARNANKSIEVGLQNIISDVFSLSAAYRYKTSKALNFHNFSVSANKAIKDNKIFFVANSNFGWASDVNAKKNLANFQSFDGKFSFFLLNAEEEVAKSNNNLVLAVGGFVNRIKNENSEKADIYFGPSARMDFVIKLDKISPYIFCDLKYNIKSKNNTKATKEEDNKIADIQTIKTNKLLFLTGAGVKIHLTDTIASDIGYIYNNSMKSHKISLSLSFFIK